MNTANTLTFYQRIGELPMRSFHILIVDDNNGERAVLKALLKQLSFTNIDEAANGFEALKQLVKQPYDLIFLDNRMPVMSGLDFLRRCKNGPILEWTTVIMLTSHADQDTLNAIRNERLKVDDFILKPITSKVVSSKIDRMLISDNGNPIQRLAHVVELPGNVEKGHFLSISTESGGSGNIATIRLFGFFMSDDRELVKSLPESLLELPEKAIVVDLTDVLMIDEFGIGILVLMNSVASMGQKRLALRLDDMTIGPQIVKLGLTRLIPVLGAP